MTPVEEAIEEDRRNYDQQCPECGCSHYYTDDYCRCDCHMFDWLNDGDDDE